MQYNNNIHPGAEQTMKFQPSGTYFTFKLLKYGVIAVITLCAYLKFEYLPILLVLIPVAVMGLYEALTLNSKYAILENEQLILHTGLLSYTTEYLELYRINHIEVRQTILMKLFRVFELQLTTCDENLLKVSLQGIDAALIDSPAVIRKLVQECKLKYRVLTVSGNQ